MRTWCAFHMSPHTAGQLHALLCMIALLRAAHASPHMPCVQDAPEDADGLEDEGVNGLRFGPRPEALTMGEGPSGRPTRTTGAAGTPS